MADVLKKLPVQFPLKGLSENYSYDVQEPGTTRDLLNVRGIDPSTGRTRGAQRSGLNRYLDDTVSDQSGGTDKVKDIISVPLNQTKISWTTDATPDRQFSIAADHKRKAIDLKKDEFGNLYLLYVTREARKYNQDGALLATIPIPEAGVVIGTAFIEVDSRQNVFIGTSGPRDQARLHAFEFQLDGTYLFAWSLNTGRSWIDGVSYLKASGTLDFFAFEEDGQLGDSFFTVYRDVTMSAAPSEETASRVTISDEGSGALPLAGQRLVVDSEGAVYGTGSSVEASGDVFETALWKFLPYGDTPSVIAYQVDHYSGMGHGIALGPENADGNNTVYVVGNVFDGSGSTGTHEGNVRRVVDTGTIFDPDGTDAWIANTGELDFIDGADVHLRRLRLAVDSDFNLYVPGVDGDDIICRIYAPEESSGSGGAPGSPLELNSFDDTDVPNDVFAVAVSGPKPGGFADGDSGSGVEEAEFVFVATAALVGTDYRAFHKYRMATVSQATPFSGSGMRTFTHLAVGGGDIEAFTAGGSFSDPTGSGESGIGALDESAPYVQSVVSIAKYDADDEVKGRLRVYYADGNTYQKYDPVDDGVTDWRSTSAGIIPPRCRLIELWQGRIVIGRDPENPVAWHMSAIAEPENWDNFPQNISPAQAISGVNAKAGDCPDVVNSFLPWDDDLLLFGCDHSIWRMSGNPMLGGRFDLVTDVVGMAFGRPWTKDPSGNVVYFMGTYGGVFALRRGGEIERLTRDRIERRMQDAINWDTHYVRLQWNYCDEGFHVFQLPYGAGGTVVKHWFWDRKNDAWYEDQFGTTADTGKQPTAVYLLDGDAPTDRTLLLGCEDGRIRAWDRGSPNDDWSSTGGSYAGGGDDLAIDSYFTVGPIQPRDSVLETQFTELTAWLATQQDGLHYNVYVDDEPEEALNQAPVAAGALNPGRNPTHLVRFAGESAFIRFRNANTGQRWAFEKATLAYSAAGQKRQRI